MDQGATNLRVVVVSVIQRHSLAGVSAAAWPVPVLVPPLLMAPARPTSDVHKSMTGLLL